MRNSLIIKSVLDDSIAKDSGIVSGDRLISINGNEIQDVFDYRFIIADENILLVVQKTSGELWEIDIEKDIYEDLGLEFESDLMSEPKNCRNKCIFCFIEQLPKGMRKTLYFKDDDTRLSFLSGNYVTLTNVSQFDLERIVKYRMSPINVSVHTTNPDLRSFMLNNKSSGDILNKIYYLTDNGIQVNAQIVLCREVNDKSELNKTINDLSKLYPRLNSISVVPAGLTKYRKKLFKLIPYDRESSAQVIQQVELLQGDNLKKYGSRIVFLADEFYIMSQKDTPMYEEYEEFPQIENGVGLMASLGHEIDVALKTIKTKLNSCQNLQREVSIATGVSAYSFVKTQAEKIMEKQSSLRIHVYPIKNTFFGENITVTGLLTGKDILEQLTGKKLGENLLLCSSMFKAGEEIMLDDITIKEIESVLSIDIIKVENIGEDFVNKILGI